MADDALFEDDELEPKIPADLEDDDDLDMGDEDEDDDLEDDDDLDALGFTKEEEEDLF